MHPVSWTQAGFRILAVWIVIEVATSIPATMFNIVTFYDSPDSPVRASSVAWAAVISTLGALAAAAILWFGARWLAAMVWEGLPSSTLTRSLSPVELQRALFAALGVYLLALGLPQFIAPIRSYFLRPEGFALEPRAAWTRQVEAVGAVLQVILGLWLLFGSHQLARWISRLRDAGMGTVGGDA